MRPFRHLSPVLCAALVVVWSAGRSHAQIEGSAPFSSAGTTSEAVADFLHKLQRAVEVDDREAVAKFVNFPLRAWNGKATGSVRDRRQFLAQYPAIFTADLQKTIAAARVERVFANWQGVMIESGGLWFRPDPDGTLRVVTINQPEPQP